MEAKPHSRTLEITVISGENIRMGRSSMADNVYVVVRAESLNCCTTKMVNEDAGLLAWNEKFLLNVPPHARSVTFEVQCKKYKGVRPIGVARIALSDFVSGNNNIVSETVPQMFSYGLRNWEGQRNGVIHFSVREVIMTLEDHSNNILETKEEKNIKTVSPRGFEHEVMGLQVHPKKTSPFVIGIPVWWRYRSVVM
ncbi:hypothetical protein Fmac_010358 [Flemingia macrophylla]|uniref:C2 domain-containing protein n=1 Tax=Flemingia macrophylla TaxID=520843 RepID=A0ABD1MK41_9FABA